MIGVERRVPWREPDVGLPRPVIVARYLEGLNDSGCNDLTCQGRKRAVSVLDPNRREVLYPYIRKRRRG